MTVRCPNCQHGDPEIRTTQRTVAGGDSRITHTYKCRGCGVRFERHEPPQQGVQHG